MILLVALLVLLPLYEFVDIGEHWPFDGQIVSAILTTLFIVAALIGMRRLAHVCFAIDRRPRGFARSSLRFSSLFCSNPQHSLAFLVRCPLRI